MLTERTDAHLGYVFQTHKKKYKIDVKEVISNSNFKPNLKKSLLALISITKNFGRFMAIEYDKCIKGIETHDTEG